MLWPVRRVEEDGGRYVRDVAGPKVRDTAPSEDGAETRLKLFEGGEN